jgi:CheY-like chemotaxis protein
MHEKNPQIFNPVVIVEDSEAERKLFQMALKELGVRNEVLFFENGKEALEFLKTTNSIPFIIICDINMPLMNGIELKAAIDTDPMLEVMSIPFIFMSSSFSMYDVLKAYKLHPQGYFTKADDFAGLQNSLNMIFTYWSQAVLPNIDTDRKTVF